jgi:hypothetical protein
MVLGVGGFVDEFEAAVSGHALGEGLSTAEVVNVVNGSRGFGFLVAHVDKPNGDFVPFFVLIGFGSIKENSPP